MGLSIKLGYLNVTFFRLIILVLKWWLTQLCCFIGIYLVHPGSFWRSQMNCFVIIFKNIYKNMVVSAQNMLHPQPPFFRYTSSSIICYITKTCMVTVFYMAGLMKQIFEQKLTTFPKFFMNVCFRPNVTGCGWTGHHDISATFINNSGNQYTLIAVIVALN